MSTRANIVVKDADDELWFYRHSDGYPSGIAETLGKFCQWVKVGRIRDNANQASGWLIAIGMEEYKGTFNRSNVFEPGAKDGMGWKVGAYEPTTGQHGDIEYLYVVDLTKKTITCKRPDGEVLFEVAFGEKWPSVK
jgi:hypothetical protein